MRVQQAVSLHQAYQSHSVASDREMKLDRVYKKRDDGSSRIDRAKTTWGRFTSRQSHRLSRVADCFCSKNRTTSREVDRFNLRHEKFSAKVQNLVCDLKAGDLKLLGDVDYVASLRHDVKLMNQDMRWAGRQNLLEARLDLELSKLNSQELAEVRVGLKNLDVSEHDARNLKDLQVIQRSVVRVELSRSPVLANSFDTLLKAKEISSNSWKAIQSQIRELENHVILAATQAGVNLDDPQVAEIIRGATVLGLKRADSVYGQQELGTMNYQFLSCRDQHWFHELNAWSKDKFIFHASDVERAFTRGIRDVYLLAKVPPTFQDENLQTHFTRIGEGAAHSVHRGDYLDTDTAASVTKVHKEDDETIVRKGRVFTAPDRIALDHQDPRLLERAVFTSRIDEFLQLGVSVKTDFALHHDRPGIVMDLAIGKPAAQMQGRVEMQAGQVQRDFIALQVLDLVTGQMDRHRNNYMVLTDSRDAYQGLAAIDSDFCMGFETSSLENLSRSRGLHFRGCPPVIDQSMLDQLRLLDSPKVEELADQMFASLSLDALQGRVNTLLKLAEEGKIRVIPSEAWGSEEVTELLEASSTASRRPRDPAFKDDLPLMSYWGREQASLQLRDIEMEIWS